MKSASHLILFLLVFLYGPTLSAQENTKHLTLEEAISAATTNNTAVTVSKLGEQIATSNYRQTDAIYLPQVGFSYTAFSTNNPLNAFGFKLQQKSISAADFNPALLNHPSSTPDFNTKLEIQQPLLNLDMNYQRKSAAKQIEVYQLGTERTKEYLSYETKKAYLQLQMLYAAANVLNEALATAKAIHKFTNDYFKQGLVQKSDLLNAEVQMMNIETQVHHSRSSIHDVSDILSLLMGKQDGIVYLVDSAYQASENIDSLVFNSSRADFKAIQREMEAYDLMIKGTKMSSLPRLNAFGSWQLNDNRLLGFGTNAYMVGMQLSWNIFNGNRTKNSISEQGLQKDRLSKQLQQQQEQAALEIQHAKRDLTDADFTMRQQRLAAAQSAEALRVIRKRYEQGLVKTTEVVMAQTQLSQQQLGFVQAVLNYNMAIAALEFLTGKKLTTIKQQ